MVGSIQQFVRTADAAIAQLYLSLFRERNAVMPFLFHSLFRNRREIELKQVDPLQETTVAEFRQFVEYYLEHGYSFISPDDLLKGLDPSKKYAMATFDDGYFNNTLALPILEEYHVPAVFFISTDHVRDNLAFWWDVLYRMRSKQGVSHDQIQDEALSMKSLKTEEMEVELRKRFGDEAFKPVGDIDRPFTPDELRDFAKHPQVHLGNHTAHHGILTNYSPDAMRSQLQGAQDYLKDITGQAPISIAYPNGGHDEQVVQICREVGLKVGFTIRPEKCLLPMSD